MGIPAELPARPLAFLTTPSSEAFGHIRQGLRATLAQFDIRTVLVEDVPPSVSLEDRVLESILQSDFVIADITGANPNVMYELGFARAARVPVIPIIQAGSGEPTAVPSSIAGLYYLTYNPANLAEVGQHIRNWFAHRPGLVGAR